MELFDPKSFLSAFVEPWYQSLRDPMKAQEGTLHRLVHEYAKTEYGEKHGARSVDGIEEFRRLFPIVDYADLQPYLDRVRKGDYAALLAEPVVRWVMTRGTTDKPKLIPTTRSHLDLILQAGARGLLNFALRNEDYGVLEGEVLNLNFPSEVGKMGGGAEDSSYGYSSGTYAKLNPGLGATRLVPKQEEIDSLGGGIGKKDWEARFEVVYQKSKDRPVKSVMGVTPVIQSFARYVKKRHRVLPKSFWQMKALFCTSVAKIQTKYASSLRYFYGEAPVVEMYTATEGVFAQQLDKQPYVCPNYDCYLFEVKTRDGVKMLHEMRPREWGRIIISGPLFPRYDIGDLVEAVGKGYYRIFGRAKMLTVLEHIGFKILTGRI